jgi:penicillin-binding protein 2
MFGFLGIGKKNKKLTVDRRHDIEPNEIFYDHREREDRRGKNQDAPADKKFEISLSKKSLYLPFVLAAAFFLIAILRVAELQIVEGQDMVRQAENNKYLFHKVQSDRGIIYDQNFKPLVENLSTFDLQCDAAKFPKTDYERKNIINSLAAALGIGAADLEAAIASGKNPTWENLNHQALIILQARAADFPACAATPRSIRGYAEGAGLAHLLGYMGKIDPEEWRSAPEMYSINDYIGRSGLEKSYEAVLRKDPGRMRLERDAKGNVVSQDITLDPQSGDNVQLWLDYDLQKKLNDSLAKQLESLGLKKGAAVALDPKTGGVLAMVSFPDYDNNVFSSASSTMVQSYLEDKNNPLFNRAISGKYLTGSTIKPLEAAAALQEKIISPEKNINCQGKISIQNQYDSSIVYNFNDNHIHGATNMYKAIAESCNVYFFTIGGGYGDQKGLGPTRIKKYLDLFGWEEPTGIDLPGETAGFVPDAAWKKEKFSGTQDQNWTDGNTYWLAIGQEFVGITPLEVANAYAAIANGGTLYRPQMVKSVVDKNKNVIEQKSPQIIRQNFIDPQNLAAVREGMRHCVNGADAPLASALTLNQLGIPMGAKTGTAQLRKGADGKDLLNAWVGVFAPYDDPQIVLLVMAEEVHEGTVAVLPVAKEVLGWYFEPKDENGVRISESAPVEATAEVASTTTEN